MNDGAPIDLREVLSNFEDELLRVLEALLIKLNTSTPPDSLFHYTNDVGLHGILESGILRLTNIFSLNDPSELSHGLSHAAALLHSQVQDRTTHEKNFADSFSDFCKHGVKHSAYFFVCSFSTNMHDLGQWRAYADNGRGFALEFDANQLASNFANDGNGADDQQYSTFPVRYADEEIVGLQHQFISSVLPLISLPFTKPCIGLSAKDYLTHLSAILSMYSLEASMYFKHTAYAAETEFRFQQLFRRYAQIENIKWRARLNELVAYREYNWRNKQPKSLKRIIIGPAADSTKATRFIRECLVAYHKDNQDDVEIIQSSIPYRAT